MGKDDLHKGWVHWSEAAEWAERRTSKGFEKPFRDWLDQLGVDYVHNVPTKGSSFVNLDQLKEKMTILSAKQKAGFPIDDDECYYIIPRDKGQ